jgi:hypothetical protein
MEELPGRHKAVTHVEPGWLRHRHLIHKAAQHVEQSKQAAQLATAGPRKDLHSVKLYGYVKGAVVKQSSRPRHSRWLCHSHLIRKAAQKVTTQRLSAQVAC